MQRKKWTEKRALRDANADILQIRASTIESNILPEDPQYGLGEKPKTWVGGPVKYD